MIIFLILLTLTVFVYILPILIGIIILGIADGYCLSNNGEKAPLWWKTVAVIITAISTVMLYIDIYNENVDTGPKPLLILLVFGLISLFCLPLMTKKVKRDNVSYTDKKIINDWKYKETWEDYPEPDYNDTHTICQISFGGDECFYYRTRNPDLKIGDTVYVPVGYNYEKKAGKIISMREYIGYKAPYPLEKTKYIIGKVEE